MIENIKSFIVNIVDFFRGLFRKGAVEVISNTPKKLSIPAYNRGREDPKTKIHRKMEQKSRRINRSYDQRKRK